MSVLIKGGRIVRAADAYVGDVFIDNSTVSLIGESLDVVADKVIDASGKYVLPGAIDPHTHIERTSRGRPQRSSCADRWSWRTTSSSLSPAPGSSSRGPASARRSLLRRRRS